MQLVKNNLYAVGQTVYELKRKCLIYSFLEMWTRYSKVFPGLWVASAYKGATGPCMVATDIGYHVENHKEWISLVESCVKPLMSKFYGYALTGWQR